MTTGFSGQILAEKLSKLNNSQQSIESLSSWCISHRKKAKQVVETWDKLFKSQKEKRVTFLYLANDILQNGKRKGSEYVNEFWRVLPAAVKEVLENGDENGRKAATRLVGIWDERKVFGSRGQGLKDEMLGKDIPPLLENNVRSTSLNSIKVLKKDAHSIRIKLAVGGTPEKIFTAFQSIYDEHLDEDTVLSKCKAAVNRVEEMGKEVGYACTQGNQPKSTLGEVQEQEDFLKKCVEQLKNVETNRESFLTQLREVLKDQEAKLDLVRTQLQVAQVQIDQVSNVKQKLGSAPIPSASPPTTTTLSSETIVVETNPSPSPIQTTNSLSLPPPVTQPMTAFTNPITPEEENRKAAAAVAAKLAASASSAQMLSAVLSSLAAEEAASMTNGVTSSGSTSLSIFPPEKRAKLDNSTPVSDMGNTTFFTNVHQQAMPNHVTANSQIQPPFPPPPPPPVPSQSLHPFTQTTNSMAGTAPYRFGSIKGLPPPPPMPTHVLMGSARPPSTPPPQQQQQQHQQQQQQQQHQQQQQQQQQQPATGGYYQPHGMVFYGQSHHQPTTPPVPRQ